MWDSLYKLLWSDTGHKEEFGQRECSFGGHGQKHGGTEVGRQMSSFADAVHPARQLNGHQDMADMSGGRGREEVWKPVMVEQYNKCDCPPENKVGKTHFEIWAQTVQMDFFSILHFCT